MTAVRDVSIEAGSYRAVVSPVGAALVALEHDGRALVRHGDDDRPDAVPLPAYRGAILAPWPNRIAGGAYEFDGAAYQLPVNERDRDTALHGLVLWDTWVVQDRTPSSVRLQTVLHPRPGYPFTLDLQVDYVVDGSSGLQIMLSARNMGTRAAPYGASIHPYLVAGAGGADDWSMSVQAAGVVVTDEVRMLPVATEPVEGTPFDFRTPRALAGISLDNALTDLTFDEAAACALTLTAGDGHGVRMHWDTVCQWLQVHTTHYADPPLYRSAVAVEPMTCPPDVFNAGTGLVRLDPGEAHTVTWRIEAC